MTTRASLLTSLLALVLCPGLAGCTTVAKQAFQEFRGARSKVLLTHNLAPDALLGYQTVRFASATTTIGDELCPPELRRQYDRFVAELALTLRDEYPGGQPTLLVSPEILYFQEKGLLSGAECLARVRMKDDTSQKLVVDAIVRTESKAFRAGGERALAESSVKAVGEFLACRGIKEKDKDEDEDENNKENENKRDD